MKKIFTLFFSLALFSVAAFAQKRDFQKDDGYNNPFQSYYNGFRDDYGKNWNNEGYGRYDYDRRFDMREWRERRRWFRRHHAQIYGNPSYYNNYGFDRFGHNGRLSLELVIGRKDRY